MKMKAVANNQKMKMKMIEKIYFLFFIVFISKNLNLTDDGYWQYPKHFKKCLRCLNILLII